MRLQLPCCPCRPVPDALSPPEEDLPLTFSELEAEVEVTTYLAVPAAVLQAEEPVPDALSPPEEDPPLTSSELEAEGEVATPLHKLHPLHVYQSHLHRLVVTQTSFYTRFVRVICDACRCVSVNWCRPGPILDLPEGGFIAKTLDWSFTDKPVKS